MPKDSHPTEIPRSRTSNLASREQRHRRIRESDPSNIAAVEQESSVNQTPHGITGARISEGTFFESSNNVQILGGHFTTTRGHQTNLTINFAHPGHEGSSGPSYSDSAGTLHQDVGSEEAHSTSRIPRDWPLPSSLPSRKSSEIYYRHLATKERGSPLWIPEPNNMLPVEYQARGIGIGDVGIITDYGGFDFLFNICAPETNPINPADLPEGFSPLNPPLGSTDIRGYSEYKSDSYIASALVGTSQRDTESIGLVFESSASEGAILTMPHGSNSRDLGNVIRFRKYAAANAERWYKYVNNVRGREARNGDVRLVIGYDSTTAWGMATFANLSEQRNFRLMFKPVGENSLGRTYGWEYSGIADVRSGPDVREIEKLRNLNHADDNIVYENQCLFVRTLNITLQDDMWDRLSDDYEMLYMDDHSDLQSSYQRSQSAAGASDRSIGTSRMGDEGKGPSSTFNSMMNSVVLSTQQKSSDVVQFSHVAPALSVHPSNFINELLLREKPNAKMAITDDGDWIFVLKQTDQVLPSPETLYTRMTAVYDICEEDGVVFLQHKTEAHFDSGRFDVLANESLTLPDSISYGRSHPGASSADDYQRHIISPESTPSSKSEKSTKAATLLQSGVENNPHKATHKNLHAVANGIFVGNIAAARSTRTLVENRITHILSVCRDPIPAELPETGIVHARINIDDVDYADLLIHLPASCRFIEQAGSSGGAVLVHSVQGISRSAAVVAAYFMYSRHIDSTQAVHITRTAHSPAWPNTGFLEQLVIFELCNYAPSLSNSIYVKWRSQLERKLRASGLSSIADATHMESIIMDSTDRSELPMNV